MTRTRRVRRWAAGAVLGALALAVLGATLVLSGRAGFVVTHGVSMSPVYDQGDLVVVAEAGHYRVGDIVAYRAPGKRTVVLHRIIGRDGAGFVMKGDNNESVDPTHPRPGQVLGRAVLHVAHGGWWLAQLTNPGVWGVLAAALVLTGGARVHHRRRRKRRRTMSDDTHHVHRRGTSQWALPPVQHTAATVAIVLGALALGMGVLSLVAPTSTAATTRETPVEAARVRFSYTATVRPSPAYDTTTVTAPDPVFLRVAKSVTAQLTYRGAPGTMTVAVRLSTPDGWQTLLPLTAPETFATTDHEVKVPLDLAAFQARAAAAAAATGGSDAPLSLDLVATVTTADGDVFAPDLRLALSPLQLTLAGDASSLTVSGPVPTVAPKQGRPVMNLLGRQVHVASLQVNAGILLGIALLEAGLILFLRRRAGPVPEAVSINRKYGLQLATVEPITPPAALPLIDVPEFATLAKIAEKAGLLVLHWVQNGVETFVVLDETTTYRFQTGDVVATTRAHDGQTPPAPVPTSHDPSPD